MSRLRVDLEHDIARALNSACAENASNTPDFILAQYLLGCLDAFDAAVKARDKWYGVALHPGRGAVSVAAASVTKGGNSQ